MRCAQRIKEIIKMTNKERNYRIKIRKGGRCGGIRTQCRAGILEIGQTADLRARLRDFQKRSADKEHRFEGKLIFHLIKTCPGPGKKLGRSNQK